MDSQFAKEKLDAAKQNYGRDIRVFETTTTSKTSNEPIIDEEAARRSRITKAVIRVRFPDNHTLEATFHPSETMQSLVDLLTKVVAQPNLPFYIYTTPPKKQIKDMSQDFYSAGFAPGDDHVGAASGPFLKEDIMLLKGLELVAEEEKPEVNQGATKLVAAGGSPAVQERKPAADKKMVKPKWLRM
ncbi:UBX-like protein [Cynara cardunculus var. scolymus]|uniref:UBX-like protein n=1 Tax=Cynara cardunculus var. scolymus TaxID=59895 RepID=A0A103Y4Q6_CYNCS|nr:UBX-like protein [Cynara cardunculus var. scolymus]